MKRRNGLEAADYEHLRELGFHFKNSQSEYSYQPDSSGVVGGRRGAQEYGIRSDFDAEGRRAQRSHNRGEIILSYGPDDVERGQEAAIEKAEGEDFEEAPELTDGELTELIERRIAEHPDFAGLKIKIDSRNNEVWLRGEVFTEAQKIRLTELIEAFPAVRGIRNTVEVLI